MVTFPVSSVQSIAVPPATNSLLINTLTLDAMTFFVLPGSPDSDTYIQLKCCPVSHILHSDLTLEPIAR
jgi:hypothetical protein